MAFGPELLAVGVILIFGGMVFLMIRASRKELQKKNRQTQQLGFTALEEAPSNLEYRVEELFKLYEKQQLEVRELYHRRELDSDVYLFDLVNTQGDDSEVGSEIFGMISPQLALPRFSLITIPEFDREGMVGSLMYSLLEKVMAVAEKRQGLQRIHLRDQPQMDKEFVIFGRDEFTLQKLISRLDLRSFQMGSLPLQIAGSGDFLTVDFTLSSSFAKSEGDLNQQYEHFRRIARQFKEK
jgi:hypothetical protein